MTMSTLIDNLNAIYNAKKEIKTALTNKGQTVGDNILDYAGAINSISSGGMPVYRNWWKVYFIDYDGTVLSYQEVNDGDDFVFPDAPNHEDKWMRFTGWNQTSNHTSDYDPRDLYTIVIGALYDVIDKPDTGENTKLMFNAHALTMTIGFTLTSKVADGITIDWGDGKTTTSSSTSSTEYTHTYDRSYLGKDVVVEIQCADGNTYTFDKVKTGLDNIMPTNVKFGKGCTSIGNRAFYDCYSLQSVTIPSSVTSIGSNAFYRCYSLQSINIPSSVTKIGNYVFVECYSLQSINIPSSVTNIYSYTFQKCYSLKSVTIPSSVTSIDDTTFSNCCSLQSVTIPSSVTKIGSYTFSSCCSLQSITIPSSVTSIGYYAFYNCSSLQSITIPSSVKSIDSDVFYQTQCILDFGNERTTVPTLQSTNYIRYNFCIVPDALYDTWCAATNWSAITDRIIKYSDFHGSAA